MKNIINQLEKREKILAIFAITFITCAIIYTFLLSPALKELKHLRVEIIKLREDFQWLKIAAPKLKQLDQNKHETLAQSLTLGSIEQSAQQYQLNQFITRIEQQKNGSISIWMENTPFNDLLNWINEIETQNHQVLKTTMSRRKNNDGTLNIHIVIK
ncbi:MAG: type II secretion system protein M [Bacteroidetes bacterium]|nr:type II secretion system protein M [Bacteroidota bacterium]